MFSYDELLDLENTYIVASTGIVWIFFTFIKPSMTKFTKLVKTKHVPSRSITIPLILVSIVAWVFIAVAAGLPVEYSKDHQNKKNVRDIFFVIDVSRSMLAVDFTPNRLEVAKNHIRDFIGFRGEDRIGVVMFAEKLITLSPLTYDQDSVLGKVSEVKVGFLGNGTNIGDAIGLASKRLADSEAKQKVLILLTDGVSNVGNLNPLQASEFAKEADVKIYSIGIGTDDTAKLPYKVGGRTFFQEIPGGSIDIDTLKEISRNTRGKFYYAKSSRALGKVFREINKLEKTEVKISGNRKFRYRYSYFLIFGLLGLFGVELFLNKKRMFGV
jgi:Ca-activated chloride channel homolog